ncbi:MAG: hypothetical protein J6Y03_06000 [Alphaproteobacteria bacterium]|nr:hypothetical protein [Alphaproteobacteria bacterium]
MKKVFFLFCLFLGNVVVAQETITLPSTFDENQMIVKKIDANGNYIPLNQVQLTENIQQVQQPVQNVQTSGNLPETPQPEAPQKKGGRLKFNDPQMQENAEKAVIRDSNEIKEAMQKAEQEGKVMTLRKSVLLEEETQSRPVERKRVRKFRVTERDYSIPRTTFGNDTLKKVELPQNLTFQTQTMTDALKDFKRESLRFEECDSEDPNCRMYEVDEEGKVIFK